MKNFRIGLSSWTYCWAIGIKGYELPQHPMTLMQLLEKAHQLGADVLQVADNYPLHLCSSDELSAFSKMAKEFNIAIEVGTRGLRRETLLKYLQIAQLLGAKLVRTLPHNDDSRPSLDCAVKCVNEVIAIFEKANVLLGIENHDYYPSLWLKTLITSVNSKHLGICLDTVNNLGQGEGETEVMNTLAAYAINFHCKDYTISRKPSMLGFDVVGTPLGQGLLNLERAQEMLPSGLSWIIELWTPWQGDLKKTIAMENDWAEKSIQTLKIFRINKTINESFEFNKSLDFPANPVAPHGQ